MSDDNEEELLDTSTSEGAEHDDSPTSTENDDAGSGTSPADKSQEPDKPKAESREDLIKALSKHSQEEDAADEEAESAEDEKSEEEPKAEAESKDEEAGEDSEGSKHDTSDKRSKAKQRFEVLTNHNKELKTKLEAEAPFADYGRKVLDFCKSAGVTTQDMSVVLAVVATSKKDPAAAATYLEKLGIKPREVVQTVKEIPIELDDKILEMVTEGHMTPEGAKALLGVTRAARASAPTSPAKKEEPKQVPPKTDVVAPTFADPQKAAYDKAVAKATVDIDLKASEYATKYPADWPKIAPGVTKAMEAYAGTHPSNWAKFFEDEVAKAVAKIKKPAPPQKTGQPLRPSSTTPSGTQKAAPTGRKALIADLVAGKVR